VRGALSKAQVEPVLQAHAGELAKCGHGAGRLHLQVAADGHVTKSAAPAAAPAERPCFEAAGRALVFPTSGGETTIHAPL
jgi:hypothetical protein